MRQKEGDEAAGKHNMGNKMEATREAAECGCNGGMEMARCEFAVRAVGQSVDGARRLYRDLGWLCGNVRCRWCKEGVAAGFGDMVRWFCGGVRSRFCGGAAGWDAVVGSTVIHRF